MTDAECPGDSRPLPSGRECIVNSMEEWREFVKDLKEKWGELWRDRIDDRVRAEGIADKDYSMLFVERGLVILATRDYKPLIFREIVEEYMSSEDYDAVSPSPSVGGWGKFVRDVLGRQNRYIKRRRPEPAKSSLSEDRQLKKGGRGWIHRF